MSDEDSENEELRKKVEPMPEYKIRFTDMSDHLVEKAIRCKLKSGSERTYLSQPIVLTENLI